MTRGVAVYNLAIGCMIPSAPGRREWLSLENVTVWMSTRTLYHKGLDMDAIRLVLRDAGSA